MKKIVILLILLAALVAVAFVARDTGENRLKPIQSRDKLLAGFDATSVRKLRLKETSKDGVKTVTVGQSGDIWVVGERSNYPANFEKIRKALLDLADQKAGNQRKLGKGAWADVKLKAPGEGKEDETGLQVELLGDGDKVLSTLVLGKNLTSTTVGKEENPMGGGGNERYARVSGDPETAVWVVNNQFYDLSTRIEDWLEKEFFDVQKIKEVAVTAPNAADSWKASRKDEGASEFTLVDAKAGEEFDNSKASLSALLSSPQFTDVLPKDKATADFMKDAVKAKITTFDDFTYDIAVLKKGTGSDEKHYLTVAVSADIPKERPPVKDEKEEDKKKADEEFANKKKAKEEKLAKEKKAEGWVYEMSSYTVGSILKKRSELMKDKPKEEPKKDAPGAVPAIPGATAPVPPAPPKPAAATPPAPKPAPITVTTPPVSVPPTPEPPKPNEVKPPPPGPSLPGDGKGDAPKADAPKPAPAPSPEPAKAK